MNFLRKREPPPEPYNARAWLERCCERLRRQYNDRAPLPGDDDDPACLSMAQMIRLFRAVKGEHLGE